MSTTTPEAAPKKPVWVRCKGPKGEGNGCSQRIFNDRIDIEYHKQHCPADLERVVADLGRRIGKLEKAEPEQIDLDDVSDDWPATPDEDDDGIDATGLADHDTETPTPVLATAHAGVFDYSRPATTLEDEDDDL